MLLFPEHTGRFPLPFSGNFQLFPEFLVLCILPLQLVCAYLDLKCSRTNSIERDNAISISRVAISNCHRQGERGARTLTLPKLQFKLGLLT